MTLDAPEKHAQHGSFLQWLVICCSAVGLFLFVFVLAIGSTIYHIRDVVSGREKHNAPKKENDVDNYKVRLPYPDMKSLKVSGDLRYYAHQLGLDLEEYKITTEDGYVLVLHRLVDPKESRVQWQAKKPLLLQHGLLSCSGAWLTPGQNSLPYYFHEQGYDVWMGNNRCGFEPQHTYYKGNLMHNEEFWDWDVRAFAQYDLPCIIDNVLAHKPDHSKVVLVAHSQGCTQTFLMLRNSNLARYHRKIEHFFALAPAVFPGPLFHDRLFIKFIHHRGPKAYTAIFGSCCFVRILGFARKHLGRTRIFSVLSYQMFKYLFGWNINNCYPDNKILHIQFYFNVTYISSKLMSWWLSNSREDGFSNQLQPKMAYKDGTNSSFTPLPTNVDNADSQLGFHAAIAEDVEKFGRLDPEKLAQLKPESAKLPEETLAVDDSKTYFPYKREWFAFNKPEDLVPMGVFICGEDYLVDGERLATHMRHYEKNFYKEGENLEVVLLPEYNHLDVIWSLNTIGKIGMRIHQKLQKSGLAESQVSEQTECGQKEGQETENQKVQN